MEGHERLLKRREVAAMFRVDAKTIGRWAEAGLLAEIRTPGGQPRYRESEVRALLADLTIDRPGGPEIPPSHRAGPATEQDRPS